jgi:hypothetical protein
VHYEFDLVVLFVLLTLANQREPFDHSYSVNGRRLVVHDLQLRINQKALDTEADELKRA